jgi:hypothetical protein
MASRKLDFVLRPVAIFSLGHRVTLFLWLPDFYILWKGRPTDAVGVLMAMHLAIALVTYNAVVRLAPDGRRSRRSGALSDVRGRWRESPASEFLTGGSRGDFL